MKIAFDVHGTLNGSKKDLLLSLLKDLQSLNHECIIWSSDPRSASDFAKEQSLKIECMQKMTKIDCRNQDHTFVDLAIDDDQSQERILGANKFIHISEISNIQNILIKLNT